MALLRTVKTVLFHGRAGGSEVAGAAYGQPAAAWKSSGQDSAKAGSSQLKLFGMTRLAGP